MQYFDLQVNGCYGADFNGDTITLDEVVLACSRLREDGVEGILATVITDEIEVMVNRLSQLANFRRSESIVAEMIHGFHIEGPFLNEQPGYIGAHPATAAKSANLDDAKRLLEATDHETCIFTLAPERDPEMKVTHYLADQGITVAAGHCNPTSDELRAGIDAGLRMFTHLGNGCPLHLHRHDNIIQRALSFHDQLWIGFIADGVHVPFTALSNYLRTAGLDRCFVVTDAISAAGLGPGEFQLGGQTVIVDEQLATWAPDHSHLMGSAGTMPNSEINLRRDLELNETAISQLLWENPRRAIGLT
ncbi:MAG: N-acetylglucosamine-6-phosphate deacetylase [Pirellulaceae bacterium]|nr:N-acetylglucosamine-6-phosphate deacetylase [Pirellulaceae bacterium]